MHGIFFDQIDRSFVGHIMAECYRDRVYDQFLRPGMVIVEAGGNVGAVSLYLSRYASRLIVLEPAAKHLECLRATVEYNKLDHVEIVPKALWAETGAMSLYHCGHNHTMHSLTAPSDESEMVNCVSMTTLLDECRIDIVDFLKLDVEGAEYAILASESFRREAHRVRSMLVEFHGHMRQDLLESAGFMWNGIKDHPTLLAAWR